MMFIYVYKCLNEKGMIIFFNNKCGFKLDSVVFEILGF